MDEIKGLAAEQLKNKTTFKNYYLYSKKFNPSLILKRVFTKIEANIREIKPSPNSVTLSSRNSFQGNFAWMK